MFGARIRPARPDYDATSFGVLRSAALALGATAVCLGRPYVYGLAIAVESGVCEVLENLLAEFDLTIGLPGCRTTVEINKACLRQSN